MLVLTLFFSDEEDGPSEGDGDVHQDMDMDGQTLPELQALSLHNAQTIVMHCALGAGVLSRQHREIVDWLVMMITRISHMFPTALMPAGLAHASREVVEGLVVVAHVMRDACIGAALIPMRRQSLGCLLRVHAQHAALYGTELVWRTGGCRRGLSGWWDLRCLDDDDEGHFAMALQQMLAAAMPGQKRYGTPTNTNNTRCGVQIASFGRIDSR